MLESITIKGFKSIRELQLDLKPLNVLIGANGAGKSNFISFFELLNHLTQEKLQLYVRQKGGANTFLYYGRKVTDKISTYLKFNKNGYCFNLLPTTEDDFIIDGEMCDFYGNDKKGVPYPEPYHVIIPSGDKESKIKSQIGQRFGVVKFVHDELLSWKVYHFHDTSESAGVKQTGDLNDDLQLHPDASNLAAFLFMLKRAFPQHYDNIKLEIRLVAPFFEDFVLETDPISDQNIRLRWKDTKSDQVFSVHSLSDGTLRFICLATLLMQPKVYRPSVIIIDEPELGLHPYAIGLLAELLKSVSVENQVIVSTQSVTLVNQFSASEIIVVDRKGGQSTFTSLKEADLDVWLEDYSIGELWEKNVIGGRPE